MGILSFLGKKARPAEDPVERVRRGGITALTGMDKDQIIQVLAWGQKTTNDYAKVLGKNALAINSRDLLPHSKKDIQTALKLLIYSSALTENGKMIENLKVSYVALATYQDVRPEAAEAMSFNHIVDLAAEIKSLPTDPEKMSAEDREKLRSIAQKLSPANDIQMQCLEKVKAETESLSREVNAFVQSLLEAIAATRDKARDPDQA
ncbi:MAG: hypothetical protein JW718_06490 [Desulfovibrionaceae bacterium]|nr:hypothetical protein [Desulfovibrionaceae bacterium]